MIDNKVVDLASYRAKREKRMLIEKYSGLEPIEKMDDEMKKNVDILIENLTTMIEMYEKRINA